MEGWLTIAEIAEHVNIPESTARRYASLFSKYTPGRIFGRSKKYSPDVIQIIRRISDLYQAGYSTEEVAEVLQKEAPQTVDVTDDESNHHVTTTPSPALIAALIAQHNQTLEKIADKLDKLPAKEDMLQLDEKLSQLPGQEDYDALKNEVSQLRAENKELKESQRQELELTKKELTNYLEQKEEEQRLRDEEREKQAEKRALWIVEKSRAGMEEKKNQPWWKFWK